MKTTRTFKKDTAVHQLRTFIEKTILDKEKMKYNDFGIVRLTKSITITIETDEKEETK
jgi:hypothetical protein